MCLAVPAKIIALQAQQGLADLHGNRVPISTLLTPQAAVGDWVLLHAGFAIQVLDEEAAGRTWAVLEQAADVVASRRETDPAQPDGDGPQPSPSRNGRIL